MEYTPPHWGTKKGKIIESIAIQWCFTFQEILDEIKIESKELHALIGELMAERLVYVYEGQYRVNKELYHEYWNYAVHFTDLPEKIHEETMETMGLTVEERVAEGIVEWVNTWIKFQRNYENEISVNKDHFYLDGNLLPTFIHDLVRRARRNIIYVAPWIEEIGVTKNLMIASAHGKTVNIITRKPDWSSTTDWQKRQAGIYEKCHSNLINAGVTIFYNNKIHGKVLLIDDVIAIVSSFNLLKNPASGLSWEAGIITYEPTIVHSIKASINKMLVR